MGKLCPTCGYYRPDRELDQDGRCRQVAECAVRRQRHQRETAPYEIARPYRPEPVETES